MKIWIAIVLGVVQGITEFLPVSSSGHLILVGELLGAESSSFFSILMHLATIVAIVLFFWKDIIWCLKHPTSKKSLYLVLSTFCTCAIGLTISRVTNLSSAIALGPGFLVSGATLVVAELLSKKLYTKKANTDLSLLKSFAVGSVQGLCVLPGLSRLGMTTSTLKMSGVSNEESTSFSFLLSVPIVFGSLILELAKGNIGSINIGAVPCIVGFFTAFVFGCLSLYILKLLIKHGKWWIFAPYLLALGTLVCIMQYA